MAVVLPSLLRHVLLSEQQVISLKAELLQKMVLKYSIQLAILTHLAKATERSTLCGLELQRKQQILA